MFIKNIRLNYKLGLIGLMLLSLAGCSASFTYNNIGWLSTFWIDDYVDLDKQQSKTVKSLIKEMRDWHRKTQLPLYKKDLITLQEILSGTPSQKILVAHFQNTKQHWQILVEHISMPLIEVAKTLDSKQRAQFIAAISDKMNEEQQEFAEQTAKERSEERLKDQLATYADWLGKLSAEQTQLITVANSEFQSTFILWQRYKQTRLDALSTAFNSDKLDNDDFTRELGRIIKNRHAFMSEELIMHDQQNLARYSALLVDLRQTLSDKQIKHARKEFTQMVDEIDDLIND